MSSPVTMYVHNFRYGHVFMNNQALRQESSIVGLRRRINIIKLRQYCAPPEKSDERQFAISMYITAYNRAIPLGIAKYDISHIVTYHRRMSFVGKGLDERELQPGDDYILLAAHALIASFDRLGTIVFTRLPSTLK